MDLKLDTVSDGNHIQAVHTDYIKVNGETYKESLVILPQSILSPWRPKSVEEVQAQELLDIVKSAPIEILILGTGRQIIFPDNALFKPLMDRHIGFEVMDTAAACRTYTVLSSEGRNVAAALLLN